MGITEPMLFEFEEALRQYFQFREDNKKGRISCLRISLWLETICKKNNLSFSLDETIRNEELAIKQVRALELLIRDVVNENLGGNENVLLKLQSLFKHLFFNSKKIICYPEQFYFDEEKLINNTYF